MPTHKVLIVDDNELNLRLAETVLSHAGLEVGLARTAAEARRRIAEREWSLILMDLRLPDGRGLDIVREVRADPARRGQRVAALTASAMVGDPGQALEAGCDAYIAKPIDVTTFAQRVRELIETPSA
ncbi:MAG TPA: response regulator [Candidatus Limnocylindrales bacterium]|nr:response regulator [Candidatus Limnocylindrales bacterium]